MESAAANALAHTHVDRVGQAGLQQSVHLCRRRVLPGLSGCAATRRLPAEPLPWERHVRQLSDRHSGRRRLPVERPVVDQSHDELQQPGEVQHLPDGSQVLGSEDRRHLPPVRRARRRSQLEVRRRLAQEPDHEFFALQWWGACQRAVRREQQRQLRHRGSCRRRIGGGHRAVSSAALPRPAPQQQLVDLQRVYPGLVL